MKLEKKKVVLLSTGTLILVSFVLLSDIRSKANHEKEFLIEAYESAKQEFKDLDKEMSVMNKEIERLEKELESVLREEQEVIQEIIEIEKIIYIEIENTEKARLEKEVKALREVLVQLQKDSEELGKQVLQQGTTIERLEKEVLLLKNQNRDSYSKEEVRKMIFDIEKELQSIIELGTPLTNEELEEIIK